MAKTLALLWDEESEAARALASVENSDVEKEQH